MYLFFNNVKYKHEYNKTVEKKKKKIKRRTGRRKFSSFGILLLVF